MRGGIWRNRIAESTRCSLAVAQVEREGGDGEGGDEGREGQRREGEGREGQRREGRESGSKKRGGREGGSKKRGGREEERVASPHEARVCLLERATNLPSPPLPRAKTQTSSGLLPP